MGKIDTYKNILRNLPDWDGYLIKESGLPGPRANLELLHAVFDVGLNRMDKQWTAKWKQTLELDN